MPNPLQGGATVSPVAPRLPAAKAVWEVNAEAKSSSAKMFGGEATITRRADNGKFQCEFLLEEHGLKLTQTLKTAESLIEAQERAEALIRNSLSKTHPELLGEIEEAEAKERVAAAGKDPF